MVSTINTLRRRPTKTVKLKGKTVASKRKRKKKCK
jgi:hypothetical protein